MPNTFEIVIIISSVCGFVMVIGGIVLLYKGTIKLEEAVEGASSALSVELADKLKLSVRYPALALFVIGLAFTSYSIYEAKTSVKTIRFTGQTYSDSNARIFIEKEWPLAVGSDGVIEEVLRPNLDTLWIVHTAPGYKPYRKPVTREDIVSGIVNVDLPNIKPIIEPTERPPTLISAAPSPPLNW